MRPHVCRFCHRNRDDHPLSRTGYKHCVYTEHRPDCPGPPTMPTECILEGDPSDYEEEALNLLQTGSITTSTTTTTNPTSSSNSLEVGMNNLSLGSTVLSSSGSTGLYRSSSMVNIPIYSSQQQQQQFGGANSFSNQDFSGLAALARSHVAQQQPSLGIQQHLGAYSGPSMEEIRKTQSSGADQVIQMLRDAIPSLGAAPLAPTLPSQQYQPRVGGPRQQPTATGSSLRQQHAFQNQQPANNLVQQLQQLREQQEQPWYSQQPQQQHQQWKQQNDDLLQMRHDMELMRQELHQTRQMQQQQQQQQPFLDTTNGPTAFLQSLAAILQPGTGGQPGLGGPLGAAKGGSANKPGRATDYAKYCKVPYAAKCKPTDINMNMFCYGFISHLLAARQGKIIMSEDEYTARMYHFLNVMETAALHSKNDDFQSYGWTVARDYDDKVMADLERGTLSWTQLGQSVHSGNFAMATAAVHRPKSAANGGIKSKEKKDEDKIQICTSFNKTEEEGCNFEAKNPGKTCCFKHICEFCWKHDRRENKHKEVVCRKKQESSQPSP